MLADIQIKIQQHAFEFSEHALTQSIVRSIFLEEVYEAFAMAEIIEV